MTVGSSESDENDIKSLTQVSLPDASTTIKREMPLRNDRGKPAHNWNKLCAVVLRSFVPFLKSLLNHSMLYEQTRMAMTMPLDQRK